MYRLIMTIIGQFLVGALFGLIPFFLGRYFGKPGIGKLGLLCCTLSGLIYLFLPCAIGFSIAVFVAKNDYARPQRQQAPKQQQTQTAAPSGGGGIGPLNVVCLSGPLRGQIYTLGRDGLMFGRDTACAVRFPADTPGISRQHCCIRWQQGVPVLTDLNSSHGTFLGNGQKLPPLYPVEIAAGSRFYLCSTGFMFQITLA